MYKQERQISLAEFISPFGKLSPENRWVRIANMIPWEKYEPEYAAQFCEDNGAPATPFRMAHHFSLREKPPFGRPVSSGVYWGH